MAERRTIETHFDGHGLNDLCIVEVDDEVEYGANHVYRIWRKRDIEDAKPKIIGWVQFQKGPRDEEGSDPGITHEVLLGILIDRLSMLQESEFKCKENEIALMKAKECLSALKDRADNREKRGVLGKNQK